MDKEQIKKLPRSTKKYVRFQKARIRREFLDKEKQDEEIKKLYEKFIQKPVKSEIKPKTFKKRKPKTAK
jgi:hypothetical protein